jgi:hypothetical protein
MSRVANKGIVERVLHALVEEDAQAMRPLQGWDDISWLAVTAGRASSRGRAS